MPDKDEDEFNDNENKFKTEYFTGVNEWWY